MRRMSGGKADGTGSRVPGRLILIIPGLIILAAAALYMTLLFSVPTVRVAVIGDSMLPSFSDGQEAVVQEGYYDSNPVERGDVVAIRIQTLDETLIRRVIALGGDTLAFPQGKVSVNGVVLNEGYLYDPGRLLSEGDLAMLMTPLERYGHVPPESLFVLNDNRDVGGDSRSLGFIPSEYVIGRVVA